MATDLYNWTKDLEARLHVFSTKSLQKSVDFLYSVRRRNEGWGLFPGLGSDLYCSALAVEALNGCPDARTAGVTADVVACLRRDFGAEPDKLPLPQLNSLLLLVLSEPNPDDVYARRLLELIPRTCEDHVSARGELTPREMWPILIAGMRRGVQTTFMRQCLDQLLRTQSKDDGSWGLSLGEGASVVSTAMAVRVLYKTNDDKVKAARSRGLDFLVGHTVKVGWENVGSTGDTFTLATVLRCLAELPAIRYREIRDGIDAIHNRVNPDGGWGGGLGEPSNVECTSLCILALAASGENRFVPIRLAQEAVHEAEEIVRKITAERDQLQQNLEERVQQNMVSVVSERDKLRKEISQARQTSEARIQSLEARLEEARLRERDILDRMTRLPGYYPFIRAHRALDVAGLVFGILACMAVWSLWEWPLPWWKWPVLASVASSIAFSWLLFTRMRRRALFRNMSTSIRFKPSPFHAEQDQDALLDPRRLYYGLADVFSELSPSLREELFYRLYKDVVDMPPDIGVRYIEDLAGRLDMASEDKRRLVRLVEMLVRLGPPERRLVVERLRSSALR